MAFEIRPIAPSEVAAFRASMMSTFGHEPAEDPDEAASALLSYFDVKRSYAAFDAGTLVGTSGAYSLDMTVPGGATVPVAGLTLVTVAPTHRRRGVLTAMMKAHFDDVGRTGECLSALWASEALIYGRFGYGHAVPARRLRLEKSGAGLDLPHPCDEGVPVAVDEARTRLPPVFDRARRTRPGMFARGDGWWDVRHFRDQRKEPGAPSRRYLVARRGGVDVGFAVYRMSPGMDDNSRPVGRLQVVELIGVDGRAEASLWQHLLSIDLFPYLDWWNAPTDSVLPHILRNPRDLTVRALESVWLRLCDMPAALTARGYRGSDRLAIGVRGDDDLAVFRLDVQDGRPDCRPSTGDADIELDLPTLSALYFGAVRPQTLARAGRIRGERDAVERADRLFANPGPAAWCPEIF